MSSEISVSTRQPGRPPPRRRRGAVFYHEIIDMTQEELDANAPQPLPVKRPRSLTMTKTQSGNEMNTQSTASSVDGKTSHTICLQHESPLMRLAVELRCIIWEEAIGGNIIHVAHYKEKLLGIRCTKKVNPESDIYDSPCWSVIFRSGVLNPTPSTFSVYRRHSDEAMPANVLALLRTCRLIYSETVDLLYRSNVFAFDHVHTALVFSRTTLKPRLDSIKTLTLQWEFEDNFKHWPSPSLRSEETWNEVCKVLASLAGLRALHLRLGGGMIRDQHLDYDAVLKPMRQIAQVKIFKVAVTWAQEACDDFNRKSNDDYPFEMVAC